jgi:hypothetical protein
MEDGRMAMLKGREAIEYVKNYGGRLAKYEDPIEMALCSITVQHAEAVCREDPGLVYLAESAAREIIVRSGIAAEAAGKACLPEAFERSDWGEVRQILCSLDREDVWIEVRAAILAADPDADV